MKSITKFFLLLVLIGALGFTGWFVWHSKQNTDKTLDQIERSNTQSANKSATTSTTTTAVQTGKLSTVTQLQTAVIAQQKASNTCLDADGRLTDETGNEVDPQFKYVASSAAFVPMCQSVSLYAFTDGTWQFIDKTQLGFKCSTLKQYSVPTQLVATQGNGTCLDDSNHQISYQL